MSATSREARGTHRPAIPWPGLMALMLLAACGGERPAAGVEGAAVTDSAPALAGDTVAPPAADTGVPVATDSSPAGATRDTAAKQQAQRPAAPSTPAQAAAPKPKPKPAPSATAQAPAAPAQDTAAPAQGGATGESQTATAQLRDQYHQAPKDTVDQATYDGWKQYNLNCARCHGEDVIGTTIAPHLVVSLKPDGPVNTQEAFVEVVCAGRPARGMPSWCALGMDPAKINQIYTYVKGRSEGKIRTGRPAVKQEG